MHIYTYVYILQLYNKYIINHLLQLLCYGLEFPRFYSFYTQSIIILYHHFSVTLPLICYPQFYSPFMSLIFQNSTYQWNQAAFVFLDLNNISWLVYNIISIFFTCQLIGFFFMSWLLWLILQQSWECRYLHDVLISFPLDILLEVGFLDHMLVLFLVSWVTSILIFHDVLIFLPTNNV